MSYTDNVRTHLALLYTYPVGIVCKEVKNIIFSQIPSPIKKNVLSLYCQYPLRTITER